MGIDTSIYQNLLRPPKSVAEYDNEYSASRQNKLAEMMDNMKIDEYRKGQERTNRLNTLLGGFKPDAAPDDQVGQLTRGGFLPEARTLAESSAKVAKERRESEKSQLETTHKRMELIGQGLGFLKDNPSMENAQRTINGFVQAGIMDAQQAQEKLTAFQADPSPQGIRNLATMGYQGALSAKDQLPKLQTFNAGDRQVNQSINPITGKATETGSTVIGQSADNRASQATTMRGQNMTDARSRQSMAQSATQHAATLAQGGKAPAGYRFTADGNMEAIPGGPSDLKNSAPAVQKTSDAKDVLSLLDEVDALLPEATGSYLGAGADSLAGMVGYGTKGAQSGAQLKALEGALIAKMPKMSGPQSDKDVLLYKQMAGQVGDATIPVSQRQAASKMIRKLNEKHAGVSGIDSLLDKYK